MLIKRNCHSKLTTETTISIPSDNWSYPYLPANRCSCRAILVRRFLSLVRVRESKEGQSVLYIIFGRKIEILLQCNKDTCEFPFHVSDNPALQYRFDFQQSAPPMFSWMNSCVPKGLRKRVTSNIRTLINGGHIVPTNSIDTSS